MSRPGFPLVNHYFRWATALRAGDGSLKTLTWTNQLGALGQGFFRPGIGIAFLGHISLPFPYGCGPLTVAGGDKMVQLEECFYK